MRPAPSRRKFLSGAIPAGFALTGRRAAASDRIRVGVIGCGGRGRSLMRILSRYPDVDIPVVSDVIEPRMEEVAKILARPPERVVDYRRILEPKTSTRW